MLMLMLVLIAQAGTRLYASFVLSVYLFSKSTNDVIKCLKLKWNHKPQVRSFTA